MNVRDDAEHRHRTKDLWEAAYLWALGFSPSHTELDYEGRVYFVWPDTGRAFDDMVKLHRSGRAEVNSLAIKQGFNTVRGMMRSALDDERRQ